MFRRASGRGDSRRANGWAVTSCPVPIGRIAKNAGLAQRRLELLLSRSKLQVSSLHVPHFTAAAEYQHGEREYRRHLLARALAWISAPRAVVARERRPVFHNEHREPDERHEPDPYLAADKQPVLSGDYSVNGKKQQSVQHLLSGI